VNWRTQSYRPLTTALVFALACGHAKPISTIVGTEGPDTLEGTSASETLRGGEGSDQLVGSICSHRPKTLSESWTSPPAKEIALRSRELK